MPRKKPAPIDVTDDSQLRPKNAPMQLDKGMVCAVNRNGYAGTGDQRPPVYRAGSMDAFALPSRVGSKLHHPTQPGQASK